MLRSGDKVTVLDANLRDFCGMFVYANKIWWDEIVCLFIYWNQILISKEVIYFEYVDR